MLTTYGCLSNVDERKNDRRDCPEVVILGLRVIPAVSNPMGPPRVVCGGMVKKESVEGPESLQDKLGIVRHDAIEEKLKPNRRQCSGLSVG